MAPVSSLDNKETLRAIDPQGMYDAVARFPDQVRNAIDIGEKLAIEPGQYRDIRRIMLCGMGGSAIGGDLARTLLQNRLPYPMHIWRSYDLPAYVGAETLVIASSYSGTTEETLAAFDRARNVRAKIFALTTGGLLGELCEQYDIPMARLQGGLQPRAALGYSFVPLMLFLQRIELSPYDADDFKSLADFLESRGEKLIFESGSDDNPAKQLALQLYGRIPIIYTGPELTDAVGTRIKGQICENAKMPAFANYFPEFNHNELVGWKLISAIRDFLRVLILRDQDDHPRISARMDIVKKIIGEENVKVTEIHSEGRNRLERMMSLVQFGDFMSVYLAALNKVDPTPVSVIDSLKEQLGKMKR
jgi:glucose/mannose-6-phosphate isomerase